MFKFTFGLVRALVFVCGLAFIGLFSAGFVTGLQEEMAKQSAHWNKQAAHWKAYEQETTLSEVDLLIVEFLAVQPRSVWPTLMSEVTDGLLVDNFVAGARDGGLEFTPAQYDVARKVIVPRIKEQMARTVEKFDPKLDKAGVMRMGVVMKRDCERFMEKYKSAMAALIVKASPTVSL